MIAYGVYGDTARADNDHQVILQFDWQMLRDAARPLSQRAPHHNGVRAEARYFFYTGNTTYGVQNLCYNAAGGEWLLAVYRGKKPSFPNYDLFVIDGTLPPRKGELVGLAGEEGLLLTAKEEGRYFPWGTTGLHALGDGYFYISHEASEKTDVRRYSAKVHLYRRAEGESVPFVAVK